MKFITLSRAELTPTVKLALARFRHRVFIDRLNWRLQEAVIGFEIDQYDHEHTIYVIALDNQDEICGCARLLPTIFPYLLNERFPALLGDMPAPQHASVWELSRLAIHRTHEASRMWPIKALLGAIVKYAVGHGAQQLIGVTVPSMERLLRRVGIAIQRIGPPIRIDGKQIVACGFNLDRQTHCALDLDPYSP